MTLRFCFRPINDVLFKSWLHIVFRLGVHHVTKIYFVSEQAGRMDVVWGETSGVKGQIWVLYPLLFLLQVTQFSAVNLQTLNLVVTLSVY